MLIKSLNFNVCVCVCTFIGGAKGGGGVGGFINRAVVLIDTSTNFERRRTVIIVSFVFLVAVAVTAMNGTFLDTKERISLNLKKPSSEGHCLLTLRSSPVNKAKNNYIL